MDNYHRIVYPQIEAGYLQGIQINVDLSSDDYQLGQVNTPISLNKRFSLLMRGSFCSCLDQYKTMTNYGSAGNLDPNHLKHNKLVQNYGSMGSHQRRDLCPNRQMRNTPNLDWWRMRGRGIGRGHGYHPLRGHVSWGVGKGQSRPGPSPWGVGKRHFRPEPSRSRGVLRGPGALYGPRLGTVKQRANYTVGETSSHSNCGKDDLEEHMKELNIKLDKYMKSVPWNQYLAFSPRHK